MTFQRSRFDQPPCFIPGSGEAWFHRYHWAPFLRVHIIPATNIPATNARNPRGPPPERPRFQSSNLTRSPRLWQKPGPPGNVKALVPEHILLTSTTVHRPCFRCFDFFCFFPDVCRSFLLGGYFEMDVLWQKLRLVCKLGFVIFVTEMDGEW